MLCFRSSGQEVSGPSGLATTDSPPTAPTRPHSSRNQGYAQRVQEHTQGTKGCGQRFPNTPGCTGKWSEGSQCPRMHKVMVRGPPTPKNAQGSGQRAPRCIPRTHRVVYLPGALPHCCGGSSQSGRQAYSLLHPQTPETPSHQTRCPRCSHPISSLGPASPGDGCYIHRWQQSPQRMSASLRRPRRRRRWHVRRQTLGWLWREA